MAVVVVIADRDADVEAGSCEPGLLCHIGEFAVAVVAEEAIAVFRRSLLQGCDVGAVGEEDVGTAVPVVIEDRNAAGHGFRRIPGWTFVTFEPELEPLEFEGDGGSTRLLASGSNNE